MSRTEPTPAELAPAYVAAFDATGLTTRDAGLPDMENGRMTA